MSPGVRDHEAFVIEQFNGLWDRGDDESAPSDHFIKAENIQYFNSGFETRDPFDVYLSPSASAIQVRRIYNYVMQTGQSILALFDGGIIRHIIGSTVSGPILTIPTMEDFGFVAISGRAYITPFKTYTDTQGKKYQLGLQNEFVYVYKGDGSPARKAAGAKPSGGPLVAVLSATLGKTDIGVHLFAVVYETNTGYFTALGPGVFAQLTLDGTHKIDISNIPVSPDAFVIKRHIVATKEIVDYNGDQAGYQFFFVPGGNIDNNTATTKTIEFFDSDLLEDASHLIDNFGEIPAGVNLNTYHSRMVVVGEFGTTETLTGLPPGILDNRSVARISFPGQPEAISKIDGLIIAPLDGNALTNAQEFSDILYLFKATRTFSYSDNGDEPATWKEQVLDQGMGAPVHGIATVLDSGGVNIDYLLIADLSGLMLFNGVYGRPELSWKIEDFWLSMNQNEYHAIQIVNDSIGKKIWLTLPDPNRTTILHANYSDGIDAKNVKWSKWTFNVDMVTLTLIETRKLIMGCHEQNPGLFGDSRAGIYYVNPAKAHDTYYIRGGPPPETVDVAIPNPTIRTAYFGE